MNHQIVISSFFHLFQGVLNKDPTVCLDRAKLPLKSVSDYKKLTKQLSGNQLIQTVDSMTKLFCDGNWSQGFER
jgi:hypothetical protein